MTDPDYSFDDCQSVAEIDRRYKEVFARLFGTGEAVRFVEVFKSAEYRSLGDASRHACERFSSSTIEREQARRDAEERRQTLAELRAQVDPHEVREWARTHGYEIGDRGRIKPEVYAEYVAARNAEATDSES